MPRSPQCSPPFLRQQNTVGDVAGHLACHIVALGGVDNRVFIGVLLFSFFVITFNQAQDLIIGGVGLTNQVTGVAISNIRFCHLECTVCHNMMLHHILHFFHDGRATEFLASKHNTLCNTANLLCSHTVFFIYCFVRFGDSNNDFGDIEHGFRTVTFDDFHILLL